MTKRLHCPHKQCQASAMDTSKERGRFLRRHPTLCSKREQRWRENLSQSAMKFGVNPEEIPA